MTYLTEDQFIQQVTISLSIRSVRPYVATHTRGFSEDKKIWLYYMRRYEVKVYFLLETLL